MFVGTNHKLSLCVRTSFQLYQTKTTCPIHVQSGLFLCFVTTSQNFMGFDKYFRMKWYSFSPWYPNVVLFLHVVCFIQSQTKHWLLFIESSEGLNCNNGTKTIRPFNSTVHVDYTSMCLCVHVCLLPRSATCWCERQYLQTAEYEMTLMAICYHLVVGSESDWVSDLTTRSRLL